MFISPCLQQQSVLSHAEKREAVQFVEAKLLGKNVERMMANSLLYRFSYCKESGSHSLSCWWKTRPQGLYRAACMQTAELRIVSILRNHHLKYSAHRLLVVYDSLRGLLLLADYIFCLIPGTHKKDPKATLFWMLIPKGRTAL